MPDFDKNLNPILLNEDSNPMNLPNPATAVSTRYANLSNTNLSPKGGNAFDDFFGSGPVISPMLPTVSAKELYDNRRYGKYDAGIVGIEDQHGYAQSNWDKAANGILKGLNLTATTVAGGFTTLYGIGKWATVGKFSDIWDNEGSRKLDEWNNEVDQTYLPNYFTDKEKNASWYSTDNWLTANFLFDKLIKNSGYAVGAMVSGNIANAGLLKAGAMLGRAASATASAAEASQAFKLFTPVLRNTARAFSAGKNIEAAAILEKELSSIADISTRASKLGELAMQTNKFAEMGDATRRTIISVYSAAGESSFEALSTANQYRESLIEQYKDTHAGEIPSGADLEKINQESEKVGKTSFLGNMALLAATEFTQLPKLLGNSYNSSRQVANSLLGRADDVLLKDAKYAAMPEVTTKFGKLYEKVEGLGKKVTGVGKYVFDPFESLQEVGQYALQVGTQNYFNKAYQTNNADVWVDGFLYGLVGKNEKGEDVGALISKEGIESGILGGITGGLMQARGTYLEQKARKSNTQSFIDGLNNAPSFKKAFIERRDAVNRGVILNQQEQDATMKGDKLEAGDLNFDSMHNYLAPRVKYGRYDMVKEDVKELRQELLKPNGIESLKEQGIANIEDTRETFLDKLNNFEKTTDYINSLYKSLNLRYSGVLTDEGKRKYSPEVIDKMVYAASKIADYDMRIPMENAPLVEAGINTLSILESIINEFSPNKIATQEAIDKINGMSNVISEKRDELKSALTSVIELSMRRKMFMDEFDQIKNKPEEFEAPSEFAFGETEQLPVSVKQKEIPEGKKRAKVGDKEIEVGKVYSLKQPMFKKQGSLIFDPKIAVLSQTLGGEFEVQMPDGSVVFMRPEEFLPYNVSEKSSVTPKLQEILDNAIDRVLGRQKYSDLKSPEKNKLDYINSLKNVDLVNEVEKEFVKQSKQYLKDLAEEIARAEKLAKYKDQLQRTQEEIQKLSSDIPTRDDESDMMIVDSFEDMKKAAERLFTSTTHISEDFETGNIPAHTTRFIEFTNNVKNLRKKFDLRVMLVTSAQENLLGLEGLSAMSFGNNVDKSLIVTKEQFDALSDEKKKEVILNGFVGSVVIKIDNRGNKTFIDKDGNSIGVVGETDATTGAPKKIDLGKVVFSTMPAVNLYNSKNDPKYRNKEQEAATRYVAAWEAYRKKLFEGDPKNSFDFDFGVSKGLPNINSASPEKNFVGDVLLDDVKRINTEQFIIVSTKGEIAHEDGNNYKFAAGRPAFKNADDLVYLNNSKFSRKKAAAIFAVLKRISEGVNKQANDGSQIDIKKDELTEFIYNTLFWYSKGGPSANKIYIDENNLLHIGKKEGDKIVESTYDFANIASFENEIVNDLVNSYHNVNNKTLALGLAKPFTEFYLDDANVLQKRVWPNYQAFLISGENPDGSKRTIDEAPLYTRISKPTAAVPYALKQKYLFLLGVELPISLPKKEDKDVKDDTTEFIFDGTTVNKYASKEIVDLGGEFEFTAILQPNGNVKATTAETTNNNVILEKINESDSLKNKIREFLKSYFPEGAIEAFGNDMKFVQLAVPTMISLDLTILRRKENQGAPASSSTSFTFTPASEIEKAVITEENYNAWSNVRDKSDFQAFVNQVRSTIASFDQAPDKSKITPENVDAMLAGVKAFANKAVRDRVVPLIIAKYKTPVSDKKADTIKTYVKGIFDEALRLGRSGYMKRVREKLTQIKEPTLVKEKKYVRVVTDSEAKLEKIEIVIGTGESYDYAFMSGFAGEGATKSTGIQLPTFIDESGKKSGVMVPERLGDFFELPSDAELATLEKAKSTSATFTPTTPYATPAGTPLTTAVTPTQVTTPSSSYIAPADLSSLEDDDTPFRKVGETGKMIERMSEAEKAYFEEFVKKNLPGIPYEYIENLVRVNGTDEEAWGVFENGVAKVYKRAAKGTAFHEIMEGVWLGFLSSEQQKALLDEMRSKKGSFLDRASGQRIDHNAATDLQLKERIMDDAAEYFAGKIPAKSITGKILQFFKAIVEFFKHWIGKPSLKEQLFRDIAKGKYKTFAFPEEKKSAPSQYKAIETSEGYLSEQTANDYVQDIAARVFQKIVENNESLFDINTSIKKLDVFKVIKQDYEKVGVSEEVYNQLVSRAKDFLGKFNIAFGEDNIMNFNDDTRTKDGYAADTFSVNFKMSSPYAVKLLISSLIRTERSSGPVGALLNIPKLDRSGSSVKGFTLVPYGQTFSTLMNKLSNVRDVPTFINKLYELAKENPDYVRLYTRLGGDMTSPTPKINFEKFKDHNWRLFVSFYQVFTKQKPEGFIQFLEDGQVYTGSANQASLIKQIADEWKENLKLLSEGADEIVKFDASTGVYKVDKDSKKWKSVNTSSPSGMVDFLSKIGIDFPLSAYNRIKSTDLEKFANAVSGIKTALNKSDTLMTVKSREFDMKGNVESLSRIYVSVTNPVEDSTFFNNMGKRQQAYTESNYPSLFESIINTVESITELKEKMPQLNDVFSSNSVILKPGGPLFDDDGFRRKNTDLKVQYILGNKNTDANKGESMSSLTIGKRTTLEINQNIRGSYYVVIPGDGSTEWMMNLGNSIAFTEIQSGDAFEKLNNIFNGYLRDEINLIIDAKNRKNKNVLTKSNQLRFMRGVLSDSLIEDIETLANTPNISNEKIDEFLNNEQNKEKIENSIKDFIDTTVKQQKKILVDNREVVSVGTEGRLVYRGLDKTMAAFGINKYNLNEKSLNDVLAFVNMNYIINQIEYHKILFGDPYQFKIKQEGNKVVIDETKRIKSFLSPRRITVNYGLLNNWLNNTLNTIDDIKLTKNDFGYHQHKDYAKTFTAKDMVIVGKLADRFPAYAKTDEADASSWMNPGAYREVKWKNGQWSPEAEAFHQWQMAYARTALAKKSRYSYPKDNRLRKNDEQLLEKECPRYYIDVLKPIASGNKFGKNQIDLVIDKTSQLPIYYQAVEDTNLEELFITMSQKGYDYVIVESGRKVGTEKSHSLYNGEGNFNTGEINNTIEVPWDAYGIQVENSYGKEKLQTRGSQLTKLATVDLYSEGEAIGETPERKKVVQEAVERNTEALKQLINNGYQNFLKKLGIEDLGTIFVAPDKRKIAKVLKEELLRTDTSYNTLDTLSIDSSTGEFEIDFESSVNYKRIKDVLYSIVDKFVGSPKMNGFPAVQVAATMWENSKEGRELVEKIKNADGTFSYKKITRDAYNALDDDAKKNVGFTSSALKFYEDENGKRHCEIMIPNWFRKKLGRDLTKEEFTKLINSDEGKKILTGIGFRIPTQALNSVEVFVVKGFLPDFMGRTVVVPSEITVKAGSDFDIDKLNLYLKNVYITPSGEIMEVPFFGFGEEAKAKMKDFIFTEDIKGMLDVDEDFIGDKEDDYDTLTDRLYNESLENEYYNSLIDVLTLPENFERLVVPNSSKPLEDIADELSDLRNEKDDPNAMRTLLNRAEMTNLRQIFVMAKNWVGRAATNITAHSLFQKTTMYVKPANYKMSLEHNTITINNESHVSFSGVFDKAGKYISDTLSMFANSFVDVVKDPYIMKILYSDRLVSTYMMLTRAGVPVKTLSYFMNQPIIREYVMQLDAQGVSPFNIKNKSILAPILSKYPVTKDELKNGVIIADDASLKNNIIAHTQGTLTKQQKIQQRLILEEFFSHFDLASQLFDMTMALNYDTTKFRSEDELYKKQMLTIAAEDTNLISSPKKIMNSSFMGDIEFALDRASEGLGSILKFNKPEFREILEKVIYEYAKNKYLGKEKFTKVAEKLTASFLDYIIQVKRPLDIKNLVVDVDSVANRIDKLRPKHPEVKILKDLVLVSSDTPGGAKTVKLRVNTKDSYDEDLYVGYMREMRDNPATKDLYEDLIRLAIIQGTYYSSVSIKNIVPSEDYARVVAPIMNNLTIDSDIMAFTKNKMFQRNLFKDENVVAKVNPKFSTTQNDNEDETDYLIGFDENDVEIYQYSTKDFPVIPALGLDQNQRVIFKLDPRSKGSTHSVITIPRLVRVGESMVDFITGRTVTRAYYSARKAKGDRTIYDVYGYKRVEEEDGSPFLTEDGYYIYKQINLLGDGQLATEYSVYPRESVINNSTVKVETELSDMDIIRYFVTSSVDVSQEKEEKEVIAFSVENMRKIAEGKKTSSLRADMEASDIGIPVGQTVKIKIGGREFNVTNRGKMNVEQAGGKLAMVKAEGLVTTPDENNKYIVDVEGVRYYTASTQTQSWMSGASSLYVYNIQPVSPAQQAPPSTPTPTAPTAPTTVSGVEITKTNYTRENVRKNPNTAYVFTENTHSITAFPNTQGGGSAIIRPEPNAFAIVTKKKYDYNTRENVDYSDTPEDFAEFTEVNTKLINELKNSGKSKIVFPQGFATDKAKMPTRFAEWLQKALLDNFGLVTELNSTKTGLISKSVSPSPTALTTPLTGEYTAQEKKIMETEEFKEFFEQQAPWLSLRQVLDYYKKCKNI